MKVESQSPSHQAEFVLPTSDYPKLLAELDGVASSFGLKRFGAAPGLNELKGREVLYAAYTGGYQGSPAAMSVTDVKSAEEVMLTLYVDYFPNVEEREKFITAVSKVIQERGGKSLSKPEHP